MDAIKQFLVRRFTVDEMVSILNFLYRMDRFNSFRLIIAR